MSIGCSEDFYSGSKGSRVVLKQEESEGKSFYQRRLEPKRYNESFCHSSHEFNTRFYDRNREKLMENANEIYHSSRENYPYGNINDAKTSMFSQEVEIDNSQNRYNDIDIERFENTQNRCIFGESERDIERLLAFSSVGCRFG